MSQTKPMWSGEGPLIKGAKDLFIAISGGAIATYLSPYMGQLLRWLLRGLGAIAAFCQFAGATETLALTGTTSDPTWILVCLGMQM